MIPVIAIANHKGGAGKTTTAYHLAMCLADTMCVLAVDLDDQAGLTSRLVQERRQYPLTVADVLMREATIEEAVTRTAHAGLDLLPADTKLSWAAAKIQAMSPNHMFLARALQQKAYGYDVIVLDCPPSADIIIVNALMAATHLVMAATPTVESWDGTVRMRGMVNELADMTGQCPELLGIVATQVVSNSKSHQSYLEQMGKDLIGCVPMRVGVDAPTQLLAAYEPIATGIWTEVMRRA